MTNPQREPAIPTEYRGVTFRSLLEAKWAIMFDLLSVSWNYEPLELGTTPGTGYIPDFLLDVAVYSRLTVKGPVLAEVRPVVTPDQFRNPINKIAKSGWRGSAVVLGAVVWTNDSPWGRETVLGRGHPSVSETHAADGANEWYPIGFHRSQRMFGMGGDDLEAAWREATRRSQWMPNR